MISTSSDGVSVNLFDVMMDCPFLMINDPFLLANHRVGIVIAVILIKFVFSLIRLNGFMWAAGFGFQKPTKKSK